MSKLTVPGFTVLTFFCMYIFILFLLSFSSFIPPLTPRMTSAPSMAVSCQFVSDCSPSLPSPSLTLPPLPAACTPPETAAPPESTRWLFSLSLSSFITSVTPVLTSVVGMAVFCVWMFCLFPLLHTAPFYASSRNGCTTGQHQLTFFWVSSAASGHLGHRGWPVLRARLFFAGYIWNVPSPLPFPSLPTTSLLSSS